jgi:cell pole-organizing protein PopZ
MSDPTPMPILTRGVKTLACKLTEDDFDERAKALAEVCQEIVAEESRGADVKAQLKARITQLEARRNELSIVVARREEMRQVGVETLADFDRGQAIEVRTDTLKILSQRPLTEGERQAHLPLAEEPQPELPLPGDDAPATVPPPEDPMVVKDPLGDPLAE